MAAHGALQGSWSAADSTDEAEAITSDQADLTDDELAITESEDRWWLEPVEAAPTDGPTLAEDSAAAAAHQEAVPEPKAQLDAGIDTRAGVQGEPEPETADGSQDEPEPPPEDPPESGSRPEPAPETRPEPEPVEAIGASFGTWFPPHAPERPARPRGTDGHATPATGERTLSVLGRTGVSAAATEQAAERVFSPAAGDVRDPAAAGRATAGSAEVNASTVGEEPPGDLGLLVGGSDSASGDLTERDRAVSLVMTAAAVLVVIFLVVGFLVIFTDLL